ncbi:casein kinase II beta subunit [Paxillus ammoniavirescens]|nr:casein kinase II beta subunit [Paxillus ammoniavirescens]
MSFTLDDHIKDELHGALALQAFLLYGVIHARWIVTSRGFAKVLEKRKMEFGRYPRISYQPQPLRPAGVSDIPFEKSVRLYCGRCEDVHSPKSSRHRPLSWQHLTILDWIC